MSKPRFLFPFASLLLLTLATPLLAEKRDVYFGTGGRNADGIYHATFDTDSGKLSDANLVAEIGSPGFLAFHPDGDKLYAVATKDKESGVAAYQVGKDGSLTLINFQPTGDGGAAHVAVHPSGKFLLTAQYGGGSVALFPLDAEGKLGPATVTEHEGGSGVVEGRQDSPHPHYCGYSPDGKFALVPDLGMDKIVIYRIDADAPSITRHAYAESVAGGGPRHMKFSPDGKFIYLLNELSLSVTTLAWDAEKGLASKLFVTPALSDEAKAGEVFNSAAEILVRPDGKFLYSSNRGHDTVTVYKAEESGDLSVIQVQPIRGAFPRNINLDPTAHWLLAAGADSNTIAVHAIDQETGRLTFQRGNVINVPSPICILFKP
ncbi:MAG: lactonase family protein [Verrucomicrobiae bacterium]|nr:lactonase family protein [Verrucomicrobiae bacterium]